MSKTLELSQGKVAIVDDSDHGWLCAWKWCALKASPGRYYAIRKDYGNGQPGVLLYLHRTIMNASDGMVVHHINGDGLDNRRRNLEMLSAREHRFTSPPKQGTTSQYKGVRRTTHGSWIAQRDNIYLGSFRTEEGAAVRYNEEVLRLGFENAHLNPVMRADVQCARARRARCDAAAKEAGAQKQQRRRALVEVLLADRTQAKLAKQLGIHFGTVSRIRRGKMPISSQIWILIQAEMARTAAEHFGEFALLNEV